MSGRAVNWSNVEDIALCQAWLIHTKTSIISVNQRNEDFWNKVMNQFHQNCSNAIIAPRSIGSIKAQWRVIESACTKYYAALLQVNRDRQSGQNADDRVTNANSVYQSRNKGKIFDFNHVWPLLQQNIKWNASLPTSATDTETDANQSEHNEDGSIPLDSDNDPPAFQPLSTIRSRPQGRNAAKKAKQGSAIQEALLREIQKQNEILKQQTEMISGYRAQLEEKERNKSEKKALKEEREIMSHDPSTMPEEIVKDYWVQRINEVMEKRRARNNSSNSGYSPSMETGYYPQAPDFPPSSNY
ncbi:hypothetical protein LWI29_028867 [Acer saccharum]|uniref:No apical meristem-associated C-terminal domain-containing protein n=1 Tax=Acer saccharum TaxID=4024 RepID=A0AA39RJK9_ACESA|nr:hypothetical protein LWI29_028867 [Acer saccharum]